MDSTEAENPSTPHQLALPFESARSTTSLSFSPTRSVEFDVVRSNVRDYSRGIFLPLVTYGTPISLLQEAQLPQMPPKRISDSLLSSFHDSFHVNTPVVEWSTFLSHYNECYQSESLHGRPQHFVALFFAILAVGSLQRPGSQNDDSNSGNGGDQFFEQARRALGGGVRSLTLDHCRVALMLSVYCMETNMRPMCRTWLATALAFSVELGLHQNNMREPTPEAEMRRIVWFSIYSRDRYFQDYCISSRCLVG